MPEKITCPASNHKTCSLSVTLPHHRYSLLGGRVSKPTNVKTAILGRAYVPRQFGVVRLTERSVATEVVLASVQSHPKGLRVGIAIGESLRLTMRESWGLGLMRFAFPDYKV